MVRRSIALVLVAVVLLGTVPGVAAADTRAGGTVVVGADETVDGLTATGGTVLVLGTVDGDVQVAAGNLRIGGTVTGDVDGFAGDLTVEGRIDGDVSVAAGNLVVRDGAEIGGDLRAGAGTVLLDGAVGGSVEVGAQTLRLGPDATVDGDLRYDARLQQASGATVAGETRQVDGLAVVPFADDSLPGLVFGAYWLLVNLVLGAALLVAFPTFSRAVADRARISPAAAAGVALLWLFGVPVLLVLLLVTVIGIPIALLGLVLYLLAIWAGSIYGRYAVGRWLLSYVAVDNRWAGLLAGFLAVFAVARIPLLGELVEFAVLLLGLGAMTATLGLRIRGRRATTARGESATGPV